MRSDPEFLKIIISIHAVSGVIALLVAPLAMLVAKGGDAHRLWGRTFFYAMAVVATTAILAGILRPNTLMALVAVFSFHMIASGYRALYLKKLHQGQRPNGVDIFLMGTAGIVNAGLFLWGLSHVLMGDRAAGPIIFLVFGTIGLSFVWRDFQRFHQRTHDKREWLYAHMSGFMGGYIGTVSAFSAVNLEMIQPVWLRWLWPTVLGVPLIVGWIRYYRKRFAGGRRTRDLFQVRIR
ncbi:MAG TPA: hypothetical protein PLN54_13530 [Flavobacteriales bacterium]|nr:hypothetical protein [Flavobacteriales bacterium]